MKVPSPCVSICSMDEASGLCKGCRRNIDEVSRWLYMSEEEKRQITLQLDARKLSGEE